MLYTLYFSVFEADSLFLVNSLDLTKTLLVLDCFLCFKVPLVVKLTSAMLLLHKRFAKGFPLLVGFILQSKSSC
jgi:hypothetical protein